MNGFLLIGNPVDHVVAHEVFTLALPGGYHFAVTTSVVGLFTAAAICAVALPAVAVAHGRRKVPRGIVNFVETLVVFIRDEVARPNIKKGVDRYMPFLLTTFFFILACNLLGLIPVGDIVGLTSRMLGGGEGEAFWGTATANIQVTGGLAVAAFILFHAAGIMQLYRDLRAGAHGHHHDGDGHGHGGMGAPVALVSTLPLYVWNFAPHLFKPQETRTARDLLSWGADLFMWGFFLPLEIVGALVKPFALCVRLFANMVAGHIVLASIGMLAVMAQNWMRYPIAGVSILGATALSLLELFVAFLQAYIFTFLSAIFIGATVAPEH